MLNKILSKSECAKCRICCSFDSYDLWETPVITDEVMELSKQVDPDVKFTYSSGARQYIMDKEPDRDLYFCPMLDHEKGCLLGDRKPFDCRIWPFRVNDLAGKRVITVSPVCGTVFSLPLSTLTGFLNEDGFADMLFRTAKLHPDMVKPYMDGYPILAVENE